MFSLQAPQPNATASGSVEVECNDDDDDNQAGRGKGCWQEQTEHSKCVSAAAMKQVQHQQYRSNVGTWAGGRDEWLLASGRQRSRADASSVEGCKLIAVVGSMQHLAVKVQRCTAPELQQVPRPLRMQCQRPTVQGWLGRGGGGQVGEVGVCWWAGASWIRLVG